MNYDFIHESYFEDILSTLVQSGKITGLQFMKLNCMKKEDAIKELKLIIK